MQAKSRYYESTELSADSVESHPCLPYVFAVSTYQVDQDPAQSTEASPEYSRRGRCKLHRVTPGEAAACTTLDAIEGEAILDAKWTLANSACGEHGYGMLGIADATGYLSLYQLGENLAFTKKAAWRMNDEKALCLSLDWSDRTKIGASDASVIVSQSNGTLATLPSLHRAEPHGIETWHAHDYEAWIAAWDCWSGANVAWSGGDDLALKGWDLRTPIHDGTREPTFTCKKGIQSHATRQHYWAVGSYDETIRIFDARNPRRPVADAPVGGGIWRAKWHPTNENALLLGCMHGGVRIVEWSPDAPIEVVCKFDQHESIAYGCDWERGAFRGTDTPGASYVYSCSFYDAALHVWAWA